MYVCWRETGVLPQGMEVQVAAQDGAHVAHESQRVQHRQQIQQRRVRWVGEPGLDWDGVICGGDMGQVCEHMESETEVVLTQISANKCM